MDLLTQAETAKLLGRTTKYVARLRAEGLPFLPGRPVMISRADLVAFVEQRKETKQCKSPKGLRTQGSKRTVRVGTKSAGQSATDKAVLEREATRAALRTASWQRKSVVR